MLFATAVLLQVSLLRENPTDFWQITSFVLLVLYLNLHYKEWTDAYGVLLTNE